MRPGFQGVGYAVVTVCVLLVTSCRGQEKAAEKNEPIRVVISEKTKVPSQMPRSYADFLDPKSPKCILKKEDIVSDGFMFWSFYGGTLDPKSREPQTSIFFYAMNPDHIRPMMADLGNLDSKLVERLKMKPNTVVVGQRRLEVLNKRLGDRIKLTSLNYEGIDLEFEIIGELPAGRYNDAAFMNEAFLKQALDDYEKNMRKAHPLADKSLNFVWLRVRDKAAFESVKAMIENAPQFEALPLKCENAAEVEMNLKMK